MQKVTAACKKFFGFVFFDTLRAAAVDKIYMKKLTSFSSSFRSKSAILIALLSVENHFVMACNNVFNTIIKEYISWSG